MRGKVTASFVLVGPITTAAFGALEHTLDALLELGNTDVSTWARPPLDPQDHSDGVNVSGTVEAQDEWDALVKFGEIMRLVLAKVGWLPYVARLDTEVVRVDRSARTATVDAIEYPDIGRKVAA